MNVQALDDKGRFYLIYTDVKSFIGSFKDTHNYLVTAENIHGPWSEPIYLNSSGFDPSLFHDRDGRKYLVNMVMDHRFLFCIEIRGNCASGVFGGRAEISWAEKGDF